MPTFREFMFGYADEERKAEAAVRLAELRAARAKRTPIASFENLSLMADGCIDGTPVKGAHAQIDLGGQGSRTTATRVVVGTVLAPGVGTIVGAVARKNRGRVYVTVTLLDGHVLSAEGKAKDESAARRFVNNVNEAGARQ